jgi:hypothetical protein
MARLVILTEGMTGRALELGVNRVTIGRTENNAFQIFEPSISTHHCEVLLRGNDVVVKDLGSTNGTYIAGAKIAQGILKPGQHLRLGDVELKFESDPAVAASPLRGTMGKKFCTGAGAGFFILVVSFAIFVFYPRGMPGQIGWWKLDAGSGTVARDSSHALMGHDGKLVRGPKWVKGRKGNALRLNGNQYVSLGNIFQDSYTEISIACWVKHGSSQWQNIVERSVWDQPDGIGLMMDYNRTSATFGHYSIGEIKSVANVQDDQWHHLVGTMAKSGSDYIYSIYVDGQLDNAMTNSVGLTATSNGWAIGARYDGTWTYRGLIEDVRIFDRALTPAEVRKLYNQ